MPTSSSTPAAGSPGWRRRPELGADTRKGYVSRTYRRLVGAAPGPLTSPVAWSGTFSGYDSYVFPHEHGHVSAVMIRPTADAGLGAYRHLDAFNAACRPPNPATDLCHGVHGYDRVAGVAPAEPLARDVYETGWRPPTAEGPTRHHIVALAEAAQDGSVTPANAAGDAPDGATSHNGSRWKNASTSHSQHGGLRRDRLLPTRSESTERAAPAIRKRGTLPDRSIWDRRVPYPIPQPPVVTATNVVVCAAAVAGRVSEAIGANIEVLGHECGHHTLTVLRKGRQAGHHAAGATCRSNDRPGDR